MENPAEEIGRRNAQFAMNNFFGDVVLDNSLRSSSLSSEEKRVLVAMSPGQTISLGGVEYVCLPAPKGLCGIMDSCEGPFSFAYLMAKVFRKEDAKKIWAEYAQKINAIL